MMASLNHGAGPTRRRVDPGQSKRRWPRARRNLLGPCSEPTTPASCWDHSRTLGPVPRAVSFSGRRERARMNDSRATMARVDRLGGTSRHTSGRRRRNPRGKRPVDHWPCSCPSAGVRPAEDGLCRRVTVPVVALDAGPKAVSRPATFRIRLPGGRHWARSPRLPWIWAAPGRGSSAMSESTLE